MAMLHSRFDIWEKIFRQFAKRFECDCAKSVPLLVPENSSGRAI
jgi:hypothetical protein